MKKFFGFPDAILQLIYPRLCVICDNYLHTQGQICFKCESHLPKTYFHAIIENKFKRKFWGRANIESATSQYFYKKGNSIQKLLHELKYNKNRELGFELSKLFYDYLAEINFLNNIDTILTVPLHKSRLIKRGFNQCDILASQIEKNNEIKIENEALIRTRGNKTQTRKSRLERWSNTSSLFKLNTKIDLNNKNVLLIDDVATTGSTLESCVNAIHLHSNAKIYIATFAYAD